MALLFCNVGWMERYQGQKKGGDRIVGGGAYVKEHGRGSEVCNFSGVGNTLYGYVQSPGQQININRIGADRDDGSVSDVTVVWTAKRPAGGTVVVGWYKNATVFRDYQRFSRLPAVQRGNGIDGYWIKAPLKHAKLLPADERTCEIPRAVKGGMGNANIWYADRRESAPIVKRVMTVLSGKKPRTQLKGSRSGTQDQDRKARVEKAAIRACCEHFEALDYAVDSVEKDNVGWDLEAQSGRLTLRIEVKGLSGTVFSVELTPNEYKAFSRKADDYRLAVVLNALDNPRLLICRYSRGQKSWIVDGNGIKSLKVQTKKSASIRCV